MRCQGLPMHHLKILPPHAPAEAPTCSYADAPAGVPEAAVLNRRMQPMPRPPATVAWSRPRNRSDFDFDGVSH
jgi:hypothetical protein